MANRAFIKIIGISLLLMNATAMVAQCPMCRMAAESNLQAGGTAGKGLNAGILYLLAIPYLLVGVIAFLWKRRQNSMR
ncbi:MAG: hypothetical protein KBF37_03740 [Saprospiraceae bacterium]|nr:hypothetical protein [Saprospiraceae bacterium]MBP9209415.1 hypothetical protein [Saprospiraceae bacterium]